MKKLIALILVMISVVGVFSGCAGSNVINQTQFEGSVEAPYEVDENGNFIYGDYFKDVTIDWWISSNYEVTGDMFLFKKIEEVVGCKINLVCYNSEDYKTKINTALNTNNLPDICSLGVGSAVYNVYGEQGAFVNLLEEYVLNRMPNFKKNVLDKEDAKPHLEPMKSSSGALYGLPRYDTEREVNHGWMYRKDIFEKHGIEMWTDTESFLNVLRQLKKLYPNSYPLTGAAMDTIFDRVIYNYGVNNTKLAYDWEKGEWFMGAATEAYYEMLMVYQTAWDEDLVDPDIFTNKVGDIDTAIINGDSFVYNSWIGRLIEENPVGQETNPDFQVSYAPHIGNGKGNQLPLVSNTNVLINAQSPALEIEACLAIWDYLYSEEGTFAATVGEEGKTYKIVDGEKVYLNADGTEMRKATIQTLEEEHGMWNAGIYVLADRESVYFTYTEEEAEAQVIGSKNGFIECPPTYFISEEHGEEFYDLAHNLTMEINQYSAKFITEGYSKEHWQAKVQDWQKKYGRAFDIMNGKV